MPSIFTLSGSDEPTVRTKPKRKAKTKKSSKAPCTVGECKDVFNKRTKRTIALCCVGKSKSRSGWLFKSKKKG